MTWPGAFVGLLYGFALGFLAGGSIAALRTASLEIYLTWVRRRVEALSLEEP